MCIAAVLHHGNFPVALFVHTILPAGRTAISVRIHARLVLESSFAQSDQQVGGRVDTGVPGDGGHPSPVRIFDHLVEGIQPHWWTNKSPVDLQGGPGQWDQRVVQRGCRYGVFPHP